MVREFVVSSISLGLGHMMCDKTRSFKILFLNNHGIKNVQE
jgi:hypothetical protein